jgi:phosphocarrier protein
MLEKEVTVVNRAGIHARPASLLVKEIQKYKSSVLFQKGTYTINAKSILGVITLGAPYGAKIKIIADGPDEKNAVDAIVKLFESKFEEE